MGDPISYDDFIFNNGMARDASSQQAYNQYLEQFNTVDMSQGKGMTAGSASLIGTGATMMSQGAGQIAAWTQRKAKYAEQRKAHDEHSRMRQRYMSLDVGDPYRDMTNPFENMTVNQQQANFEAQQQQQGLANMMGALQGAAGGSGIASLAQMMANQQT